MSLVLVDRQQGVRDRKMGALLRVAQQERIPVRTSPAVAQVWRHGARQAQLARTLAGIAVPPLDLDTGKRLLDALSVSTSIVSV